jgi:hypothetical protein
VLQAIFIDFYFTVLSEAFLKLQMRSSEFRKNTHMAAVVYLRIYIPVEYVSIHTSQEMHVVCLKHHSLRRSEIKVMFVLESCTQEFCLVKE